MPVFLFNKYTVLNKKMLILFNTVYLLNKKSYICTIIYSQ